MSYKAIGNCLKVSLVLFALQLFQVAYGQTPTSRLDNIVNEKSKALKTDMALVVASKDTVAYQKDSKLFSIARGQAPVGGSSQWLTTALVLIFVDEGKISLDDKVAQYLPVFEKYGKNYITLRHCLSHFMGIQTETRGRLFSKQKFASLDEAVNNIASREIQANAGTEFRYNDMGFIIAARILEVVSKKRFDMLAQQKLFRPLGMRQTSFSTMDGSVVDPAAGARSTAADYTRFLRMLLNGGMHYGQRILNEGSVAELRKIHGTAAVIKSAPRDTEGFAYALGVWAPEQSPSGQAAVLFAPSNGGAIPVVDFCRGYAFVLLAKEAKEPLNRNEFIALKEETDKMFPSQCQ